VALHLIIFGYYTMPEGKAMINKIIKNSNNNRYSTNVDKFSAINIDEIKSLFEIKPPFDIQTGISHFNLAKNFSISKGSRKGFKVHIYKNGVEITGSLFSSFRLGGKAIGLNSVSSIRNYIDTNKIFKNEYTFYSSKKQ
jgi:hypothetical protein